MVAPRIPALTWRAYERRVARDWQRLLADSSANEAAVQAFLEQHPCLVPFPDGFVEGSEIRGAHGSYWHAVFTQPVLPGLERPVPDFMRIVRNSQSIQPILIEIESPQKTWARRDRQQPETYTQAMTQISDWRVWLNDPVNILQFMELYRIPRLQRGRLFRPKYVLVFGRRSESQGHEVEHGRREAMAPEGVTTMTFDRLYPNYYGQNDVTVRVSGRRLTAVAVQPTIHPTPRVAADLAEIEGWNDALGTSAYLSARQRASLQQQLEQLVESHREALKSRDGFHIV